MTSVDRTPRRDRCPSPGPCCLTWPCERIAERNASPSVDRTTWTQRREQIAAAYSEPHSHGNAERLFNELVEVINQANALDALVESSSVERDALRKAAQKVIGTYAGASAMAALRGALSYNPDGTWECTEDHRMTPCGHCAACIAVRSRSAVSRDNHDEILAERDSLAAKITAVEAALNGTATLDSLHRYDCWDSDGHDDCSDIVAAVLSPVRAALNAPSVSGGEDPKP